MKYFLFDTIDDKDKFDIHTSIAKVMARTIKKIEMSNCSFNIGLFGIWGSGKSFIVNKIKELLDDSKDVIVLDIDMWKFNGTSLRRSILFEIEKQLIQKEIIDKEYTNEKDLNLKDMLNKETAMKKEFKINSKTMTTELKKISMQLIIVFVIILVAFFIKEIFFTIPNNIECINKLKKWKHFTLIDIVLNSATYLISSIGVAGLIFKILSGSMQKFLKTVILRSYEVEQKLLPTFSPEQFEEIFCDIVRKVKEKGFKKLVIVFDNIDRCDPKSAYEVMSTIKTYMDVKDCLYIIPCDDEAIKYYLSQKIGNSEKGDKLSISRTYSDEFIDKFFQVNFRIPTLKESDRDEYIRDMINKLPFNELRSNEISKLTQVLYYAYRGQTPRQIKRFINDYAMYYYIALEIDEERKFILDDISTFTIMIAIKQRWNYFERCILNDPDIIEDYYQGNNNIISNDELRIFLDKVKIWMDTSKSLTPYIFMKKSNDNIDIGEQLRSGKINSELNDETIIFIERWINKWKQDSSLTYLYQSYKALINLKQLYKYEKLIICLHELHYKKYKNNEMCIYFINNSTKEDIIKLYQLECGIIDLKLTKKFAGLIVSKINSGIESDKLEVIIEIIFKIEQPKQSLFSLNQIKSILHNSEVNNKIFLSTIDLILKYERYDYISMDIFNSMIDKIGNEHINKKLKELIPHLTDEIKLQCLKNSIIKFNNTIPTSNATNIKQYSNIVYYLLQETKDNYNDEIIAQLKILIKSLIPSYSEYDSIIMLFKRASKIIEEYDREKTEITLELKELLDS
ncbi:hypothetical protein AN1V17_42140 [Vallitalea sediminicola]